MKTRIRKSSLKNRRRNGFRAKPRSHQPKKKKVKNIKLALRARRRRLKHL